MSSLWGQRTLQDSLAGLGQGPGQARGDHVPGASPIEFLKVAVRTDENTSDILWTEGRHTSSEVLPAQGLVIYIGSRNMQLPWQQRHEAALVVTKVSAPPMSVRACRGRAHGWSIRSCASSLAALVVNHFLIMLDLVGLDSFPAQGQLHLCG
jgi:nitroreductase